jgi:hypothetical protein
MYSIDFPGCSAPSKGASPKPPPFTPSHRKKLDLDPGVLCWALYDSLDVEFSRYIKQHAPALRKLDGVDLIWHQFKQPEKSIQIKQVLLCKEVDIDFNDMPGLLFFDAFSETSEAYIYRIDDTSASTIKADLRFVFNMVRSHYAPPSAIEKLDDKSAGEYSRTLRQARINFMRALAPSDRVKRIKMFAAKNGLNLINMISNVAKPLV